MKNRKLREIGRAHICRTTLYFVFEILSLACAFLITYFGAQLISDVGLETMDKAKQTLLVLVLASIAMVFFDLFSSYFLFTSTANISKDYESYMIKHLQKLKVDTFEASSHGAMLQHSINDASSYAMQKRNIMTKITDLMFQVIMVGYLIYLNIYFGLFMLVTFVLIIIWEFCTYQRTIRRGKVCRQTTILFSGLNDEIIKSHKDVKALNTAEELKDKSLNRLEKYRYATYLEGMTGLKVSAVSSLITKLYMGLAPIVLGIILQNWAMSIAGAVFILSNANSLYYVINQLRYLIKFNSYKKVASDKMDEFVDVGQFPIDEFGELEVERLKGDIEFKNVGFEYVYNYSSEAQDLSYEELWEKEKTKQYKIGGVAKQKEESKQITKRVFDNLNFSIKAGQIVAFAGESGSGKSTIMNLIAKLSTANSGQVLIDGVDINEYTRNTIRSNICMVSQNTYIFNGTIRENLLLVKPNATEEELKAVCKKAYMNEFLKDFEKGIDTLVGENGIKLSGGQKQRVAIARAFLCDAPIVIFDESTSALDNEAQAHIQNAISKFKGKTVIVVAHRLSTIMNADCIYYLQEGVIANYGTFDELIEKDESFKELFMSETIL